MKQVELVKSPVQFVEDREEGLHKYYMGFNELTGVTTILNAVIFRDKYCGINRKVLNQAARRGTAIHEALQAYLTGQPLQLADDLKPYELDAIEARTAWDRQNDGPIFQETLRAFKLGAEVEYLVSDCKEVATKIDVVTSSEVYDELNGIDISDIKTTYQLDDDYLEWQLSVEKYYFERQNPGLKVRRLLVYWWDRQRKVWVLKEYQYKGDELVERLLAAWRAGEYWGLPAAKEQQVPAVIVNIANIYAELVADAEAAEARRDEFRDRLKEAMKEHGVKSFKADGFSVSYTEPGTTSKFDKKGLLAARPDLKEVIEKFTSTSAKADSITIRMK